MNAIVSTHYQAPGWFTRNVFNPLIAGMARLGVSMRGSRELAVRGRVSGEWRTIPVNPLTLGATRYLVAPRGTTEWVRNIRIAGGGTLRLGRTTEPFRIRELDDNEKVPVLREYLRRWKAEVGVFFDGVGPDSTDSEIAAIAHKHPVFETLR
jgi:hypothetical protein